MKGQSLHRLDLDTGFTLKVGSGGLAGLVRIDSCGYQVIPSRGGCVGVIQGVAFMYDKQS